MKRDLTRWERTPLFTTLHDDMNRMLESFWDTKSFGTGWNPDVDIAETDKEIIVKAEIPGVDPKEMDISIGDDKLTIKGEKKEEKEDKGKSYHHVKTDEIVAKNHQGVLEITLPKMEEAKTKKITVKTA